MEACDKWLDQVRNEDYGEADFSSLITRTQKEVARALHTILRGSVEDSKPSPRMPTADTARGKAAREPGGKKIGPAEDNEKPYTSGAVQLSIDESGGHTVDLQQRLVVDGPPWNENARYDNAPRHELRCCAIL
eukprot:GEMP01089618.1.p1 GENE.GEMP01089618.1~~GEMP01089618.1.p1  ORF type:complete len:133 (+),score=37.36 GEMP01089618.1:411-809(+)